MLRPDRRTVTIRASVEDVQFELMLTIGLVVLVISCFCARWRPRSSQRGLAPVAVGHVRRDVHAGRFPISKYLTLMAPGRSHNGVASSRYDLWMIRDIAALRPNREEHPCRRPFKGFGRDRLHHSLASISTRLDGRLDYAVVHGVHRRPLFREFAVTLSVTILFSAIVSLTLTPMMGRAALEAQTRIEGRAVLRTSEHASSR